MKLSYSDLLNRVVYLGFGLLLGLQITQHFAKNNAGLVTVNQTDMIAADDDRLKEFLARIIQDEINKQLSGLSADIAGIASRELEQNQAFDTSDETFSYKDNESIAGAELQDTYEKVNQQMSSFEAANQLIDNAIAVNNWDAEVEKELLQILNRLSAEQEYEIRVKYSSAINEGLIEPSMPLGLLTVQ